MGFSLEYNYAAKHAIMLAYYKWFLTMVKIQKVGPILASKHLTNVLIKSCSMVGQSLVNPGQS